MYYLEKNNINAKKERREKLWLLKYYLSLISLMPNRKNTSVCGRNTQIQAPGKIG